MRTIELNREYRKPGRGGVLFDACHGMVNFDNDVATAAVSQGFWPDIISTDFSPKTLYSPPVVSLPRLVSKFVALGMSLKEALKRVTLTPAEMVGISSELGDLSPGSIADIAIFKPEEKLQEYPDFHGKPLGGNLHLSPRSTIKGGKNCLCNGGSILSRIIYRDHHYGYQYINQGRRRCSAANCSSEILL